MKDLQSGPCDSSHVKFEFASSVAKCLFNIGKEMVKMDSDQLIEFEEDVKPKLQEILGVKKWFFKQLGIEIMKLHIRKNVFFRLFSSFSVIDAF